MGDIARVRARFPHREVSDTVSEGVARAGAEARSIAVRLASIRGRGSESHVSITAGAISGATIPAGIVG